MKKTIAIPVFDTILKVKCEESQEQEYRELGDFFVKKTQELKEKYPENNHEIILAAYIIRLLKKIQNLKDENKDYQKKVGAIHARVDELVKKL